MIARKRTTIPTLEISINRKLSEYGLKASAAAVRQLVAICTAAIIEGGNQTLDNVIGSYLGFTEMQPAGFGIDPSLKPTPAPKKLRGRPRKVAKKPSNRFAGA